jgi:hypothetical protein
LDKLMKILANHGEHGARLHRTNHAMKKTIALLIVASPLFLAGCRTSNQATSCQCQNTAIPGTTNSALTSPNVLPPALSANQAARLAIQLANAKAEATYQRQPFHDGQPATFVSGHWVWRELAPGDFEATVELSADGSTNSVAINILSNFAF